MEVILLELGLGSALGDCGHQDRDDRVYSLEMARNYFWREFGVEWGRYCSMDRPLVVAFKEREGYLGIDWD